MLPPSSRANLDGVFSTAIADQMSRAGPLRRRRIAGIAMTTPTMNAATIAMIRSSRKSTSKRSPPRLERLRLVNVNRIAINSSCAAKLTPLSMMLALNAAAAGTP